MKHVLWVCDRCRKEEANEGRTIFAKTWAPAMDLCPACAEELDQLMKAFRDSDATRVYKLVEVPE